MDINDLMSERKEMPPYVQFQRIPKENKVASEREGRMVYIDVDEAWITPVGSRDMMKHSVKDWLTGLREKVRLNRYPREWLDKHERDYKLWQEGQEIPLEGTPIKGWGLLSPAQQEMLIKMNVRTVEVLAKLNDEGIKNLGMGGLDLKRKAQNWLDQHHDAGVMAQNMSALQKENELLKANLESLGEKFELLKRQLDQGIPTVAATTIDPPALPPKRPSRSRKKGQEACPS